MAEDSPRDGNFVPAALFQIDGQARGQLMAGQIDQATGRILVDSGGGGGGGTVTSVSVVSANGFSGSVATATTTPAITIMTTLTAGQIPVANGSNGFQSAPLTGTGNIVLATSPTFSGATITTSTVNGVTLTTGGGTTTFLNANGTYSTPSAGTGDVVGPASATDNAVVRFDGTTGKLIQNSAATVADTTGDITAGKYNGLTITTSTGTLTMANAKVLTISNTLTFTGTDGSSVAFGAGGTVLYAASTIPLTVGTTTIASGTTARILYDNAGVLGEYTLSGSGTVVAMATAPTFTTSITTPSVLATANDSGALGASGTAFADLFLASGGVINWAAGDYTLTHSTGILTASKDIRITTTGTNASSVPTLASTVTFTNKRITRRTASTAGPGATPTTNSNNVDIQIFTALAANITSMTTNLTGTANNGDFLEFWLTDNGTARTITWGASFAATTVALPTTTVISTKLRVLFEWGGSTWDVVAVA